MKYLIAIFLTASSFTFTTAQSQDTTAQIIETTDTLYLSINEKLFFEAKADANHHLSFKAVKDITAKEKTITIELTFTSGSGAFLKIFNPFSEQLTYKAELYSYKKKDYVETTTVPVYPKISSFETWPYKIDKIRLTGFVLSRTE